MTMTLYEATKLARAYVTDKGDPDGAIRASIDAAISIEPTPVNARLLAAHRAIVARIMGEWDQPDLMAFGPLSTDSETDCKDIAKKAIAEAEAQPVEPINTRLLAAAQTLVRRIERDNLIVATTNIKEAIAEAEAQAKPNAPSYDELLDGLADTAEHMLQFCYGKDVVDGRIQVVNKLARALLARAGRT